MTHCIASPSSSERWLQCTGSLFLTEKYEPPRQQTPALEQGTRLHNVAHEYFTTENPTALAEQYRASGALHEARLYDYYKYVRGLQGALIDTASGASPALHIESKVSMDSLMDGMCGTPDAVIYNDNTLHIIDLKTGRIPVRATENSQLMLYAFGAIQTYKTHPTNIMLHIYQSNDTLGDKIDTTSVSVPQLYTFAECVRSILKLYMRGILKYRTGEHCHYCPVAKVCPSRIQQCLNNYTTLSGDEYNLDVLSVPEMIRILAVYKDLAPFMETIQTRLLETPEQELSKYHLTIKTRRAPQKYTDETGALQALLDSGAPADEVAPRALLSPSKLKKLNSEYYKQAEPFLDIPTESKYLKFNKNPLEPNKTIDNQTKNEV